MNMILNSEYECANKNILVQELELRIRILIRNCVNVNLHVNDISYSYILKQYNKLYVNI